MTDISEFKQESHGHLNSIYDEIHPEAGRSILYGRALTKNKGISKANSKNSAHRQKERGVIFQP